MLYNPLKDKITRTLDIPVYYTGLAKIATVCSSNGVTKKYKINRDYKITLDVSLPSEGYDWYTIY